MEPRYIKHGETGKDKAATTEYRSWASMKNRCLNSKDAKYKYWGGRGIKICDRWLGPDGFINFLADMGRKPSLTHSIDRYPNKDGDYEPGNCRWATKVEQVRNRSNTIWLEYKGRRMVLKLWMEELGVSKTAIDHHLKKGRPFEWIYEYLKNNPIPKDYGKPIPIKAIVNGKVVIFESARQAGAAFGVKGDTIRKYCNSTKPITHEKLKGCEFMVNV